MKLIVLSLLLIASQVSFAVETFTIPFENGDVELTADVEESPLGDGFSVQNLKIEIPGKSHGKLHLVGEFGRGDSPYGFLCETLSLALYQTKAFKHPTAYGYLESFGILSGVFSTPEYFIVQMNKTFSVSDSYPNASFDSGFSCYNRSVEY